MKLRLSPHFLTLLLTVMIPVGAARAGQLVIVESQSDRYYSGEVLESGCSVRLVEGEALTFLSESGKFSKLTGPHNGSPLLESSPIRVGLLPALDVLIATPDADLTKMGASRGVEAPEGTTSEPVAPSAWNLVPARGGTQCIAEGLPVSLWRADAGSGVRLVIKKLEPHQRHEMAWPAGEDQVAWPEEMSLTEGGTYLIQVGQSGPFHQLKLRRLSRSASAGTQAVAWLFARDCTHQARLLYQEIQGNAKTEASNPAQSRSLK